ncbi:MAG: DNA ligase [Euryarchaeota archaeon HGW-Euryarchaeota-1]|nr:MAG: DNA ligase [Euryarchaeota archaeon HGW-Euryarchaeota-1]
MKYLKLAELYEVLEKTPSTLEKTKTMSDFLKKTPKEKMVVVVLLILGRISSKIEGTVFNLAENIIIKAISISSGKSSDYIKGIFAKTGDLGLTAEKILATNYQKPLFSKELNVSEAIVELRNIASIEGKRSQDIKMSLLINLLNQSSPLEKRYLIRTVLGQLRTGVSDALVRNSLCQAFDKDPAIVQKALDYTNDISEVTLAVVENKVETIKPQLFKPISSMLAQKEPSIEEALKRFENPPAIEQKYDGMRAQIHKKGDKVIIFTRRLENITKQFPDIVQLIKNNIKADELIIDCEIVAVDENRKPKQFQFLSQRVKRKYSIEKIADEIPAEVNIFDCLYVNKELLINQPFKNRREKLESLILEDKNIHLAKQIISNDVQEIDKFYKETLAIGHEGIMIKSRDSPYVPGNRVGHMIKIKPTLETLDLVIVGADWGQGKRAQWFGSFLLACINKQTGEFLTIGKLGSGLTDEEFTTITAELKKDIINSSEGTSVQVYPRIVVEVAYEEIQTSPSYTSGYALRFPRLVRFRNDRSAEDASDLVFVEEIYNQQRGKSLENKPTNLNVNNH